MRFAPGLSPMAAPVRGRAAGLTPPGRVVPQGLIPQPQARLDDVTGWTLGDGWSPVPGALTKGTSGSNSHVIYEVAIPAGDVWLAYTVTGATAGNASAHLLGPYQTGGFSNKVTAQHVARFSGGAHARLRVTGSTTFNGTIEDIQAVDMTALLAQPTDIYIAAGQSLMAAESKSTPVDPAKDYWVPRCLYLPGADVGTYGVKQDVPAACTAPLQMTQISQGVSPAQAFAREIEKSTAAGRTVTILACAKGGTRLVGADAHWNPSGTGATGGTLYAPMRDRALAALAANPGNRVKALLWAQGESDRSSAIDTVYPPAFAGMLGQLRSDLGAPDMPAVILGPMPEDTSVHQTRFLQTQAALDQDSGDATALPGVHYVARESGYMSPDGTHPEPEGNRIVGRAAARRFVAEGYL